MDSTYDTDFYDWAMTQSALLREGRLADADIANIAEEIESMGRSEKRELVSRLSVLLMHLLKWQMQPTYRCTSWQLTIKDQRDQLEDHLLDNPSLKATLTETMQRAHSRAVTNAARETGIDVRTFPPRPTWTYAQITDPDFWPE